MEYLGNSPIVPLHEKVAGASHRLEASAKLRDHL